MTQKFYLTKERVAALQESIGFLDTYVLKEDEEHHIGPNINTIDVKETNLLYELGQINARRQYIIKQLSNQ